MNKMNKGCASALKGKRDKELDENKEERLVLSSNSDLLGLRLVCARRLQVQTVQNLVLYPLLGAYHTS